MNKTEAYLVMVKFIEGYYRRTGSDDIGSMLSDMILLSPEQTADPAAWEDWLKCINEVVK